jgi:hypothetical protein
VASILGAVSVISDAIVGPPQPGDPAVVMEPAGGGQASSGPVAIMDAAPQYEAVIEAG